MSLDLDLDVSDVIALSFTTDHKGCDKTKAVLSILKQIQIMANINIYNLHCFLGFSIRVDRGSLTEVQNKHIKQLFSNVLFTEHEEKML